MGTSYRRNSLFFYTLVAVLISACEIWRLPKESGAVLFQDNFSSSSSGWNHKQDAAYFSGYYDGSYRIAIFQPNLEVWALPGLEFSDVAIDVSVSKVDGPDNNIFGVLCRYEDPGDFYFFIISSDGYAGIGHYHDGEREMLSGQPLLPSDAIMQATATNRLHIECDGDRLALSANGDLIHEAHSSLLRSGDVGLFAGTYDQAGTDIRFDDFSVSNP
jgi:hypothetical protein